jgi:hypothetical protein
MAILRKNQRIYFSVNSDGLFRNKKSGRNAMLKQENSLLFFRFIANMFGYFCLIGRLGIFA